MTTPGDILVEAAGNPKAGYRVACAAIEAGRHVAMVSKEADTVAGVTMSPPAAAKRCGLHHDLVFDPRSGQVRQLDETRAIPEMAVVVQNARLVADVEAMHYPVARAAEPSGIYALREGGGILLKPGMTVYLDAGSTTACLIPQIIALADMTVITNDFHVALVLGEARSARGRGQAGRSAESRARCARCEGAHHQRGRRALHRKQCRSEEVHRTADPAHGQGMRDGNIKAE